MGRPLLLVLRALGLGDLATVVPALRGLRRAYPDHEMVLAGPAPLAPLVGATGAVDRLYVTPAYVRAPIEELHWRGPRPRLAVNLHGSGPQSHRALLATGPDRFVGYACPAAGQLDGPPWSDDEHEVQRWCRLLTWAGVEADADDLALPVPDAPRGLCGTIVLHPGASGPERRWPIVRFAAVARVLARTGHRVVITGSRAEAGDAAAVAGGAGLPPSAVLAGRTDLAALSAVVAHARLLVCGDTGVAHLASAYGTPSVVLFGPVSPAKWGPPPGRRQHTVIWHGPDGLNRITVGEVCDAALTLLGSRSSRLAAEPMAAETCRDAAAAC
jgi:ADP-heptose:LPS heptosyltransferase